MLAAEARWFADRLANLPEEHVYPLCNLGSADEAMRCKVQPWIDRLLFAPARAVGRPVVHVDQKQTAGVDLSGDLEDDAFLAVLESRMFRSVLCANLLEHVVDPARLAVRCARIVPPGGYLFVSVPYRFPYHEDPIDTLFRPSPKQLAALFPGTHVCEQAIVSGGTMFGYIARRLKHPVALWGSVMRNSGVSPTIENVPSDGVKPNTSAANGLSPAASRSLFRYLPWFFKSFQVSCVILKKEVSG